MNNKNDGSVDVKMDDDHNTVKMNKNGVPASSPGAYIRGSNGAASAFSARQNHTA